MREFLKDWRRWSWAERSAGLAILAVRFASIPAAFALKVF
jgi:hypothetical protein